MGKQNLWDKIKELISSAILNLFLQINEVTEEEFWERLHYEKDRYRELPSRQFFELVDSNGIGNDFKMVHIENVRHYFFECFGISPPPFPQIEETQKKSRKKR